MSGIEDSKNATTFHIANSYNNKIIVHSTTDYYVLMELKDNNLSRTYQIVPSDEIGTITIKEVGKLNLTKIEKQPSVIQ